MAIVLTASGLKKELAELLDIKTKEADDILWAIQEVCSNTVEQGGTLTLPGVGKLECNVRPARKARNPRTGEPVSVPAKVAVKFKIAKALKDSAPDIKSKAGKALLADAEEKQELRERNKRKRERLAKKEGDGKSKKSKKKGKVSKQRTTASRY